MAAPSGAALESTSFDLLSNQTKQKIADFQTINRVEITQAAIEAIANHAARLPGRSSFLVLQVALRDDHNLHIPREGSNLLNQIA